jgi:hypothetical protein
LFYLTTAVQNKFLLQSARLSTHPKCEPPQQISSNSYKKIGSRSDRVVYAAAVIKTEWGTNERLKERILA